jgi:pimeloyl-ACP methyl ester carboxylesterase
MTNSAASEQEPVFTEIGEASGRRRIAVRARQGSAPGLFWLGGFHSDMSGTKALAVDAWAAEQGRACVRFDYSGHGESGGTFADGTIGRWLEESVAVFERFCRGSQIVIGSSMGGWMALLLARELAKRPGCRASLAGLVLIAPAPDFTEQLMWNGFPPEVKQAIESKGVWLRLSWQHAFALAHRLPADDVVLTMIQDGDHRLSRPQDIARMIAAVAEIR